MDDFKGSRTPWTVDRWFDKQNNEHYIICSENNKSIASIFAFDPNIISKEIQFSNAQLIATAPEILKVLLEVKQAMDSEEYQLNYDDLHEKVRSVINKALGKED